MWLRNDPTTINTMIWWMGWMADDDNESAHANYGSNGMDDEIYLAPTYYSEKDDY